MTSGPKRPQYPFEPRSNAYLEPGQFWSIPLRDGRFAAGLVLSVPTEQTAPHMAISRAGFVAGLLDWVGAHQPTQDLVADRALLDWGNVHVKCVRETGRQVLGKTTAPSNELYAVSHRGGGMVGLYCNGNFVRSGTTEEARSLPLMGTWGFLHIKDIAEYVFVDGGIFQVK